MELGETDDPVDHVELGETDDRAESAGPADCGTRVPTAWTSPVLEGWFRRRPEVLVPVPKF